MCDHVHMYGFSFHTGPRPQAPAASAASCTNRYHYYDDLGWRNLINSHDLKREHTLVLRLERAGLLCIH